jgi:hypothetical protein
MNWLIGLAALTVCAAAPAAELRAGVAKASINTLEAEIPTQLGGYGARNGQPAEGTHDTIWAKALVLEWAGQKSALVTLDVCGVPLNVTEEALAKTGIAGLTVDRCLVAASHTHTGLEGFALDRRNIAGNPHIGVFSEPMLNFVTDRIAQALRDADAALQPVRAGSGQVKLSGMNRNRRGDTCVDEDLTVLRLDRADGAPLAVFVNFTAHGTIVDETDMLVSGEWAGVMQRTVEALFGSNVTCLYANGAEGDIAPASARGGSHWEMIEDYGRRVGIAAHGLASGVKTADVEKFAVESAWIPLPPRQGAPDFVKIAGEEYHVTEEQLNALLPVLFPDKAPTYALRINDFQLASFPGEPICVLGTAVKDALRQAGIAHPCVTSLTTDSVGYILTPEEYGQSGYEVTASFYGDQLGPLVLSAVTSLAEDVAKGK